MTRLALALALLPMIAGSGAWAQDAGVGDAEEGLAIYAAFCATCHGPTAEGTGPTAEIMTIQPPNLTRLSATNEGVFPLARVVSRIDGRDPLVAHGSPMPLFGPFFEGEDIAMKTPAGQPVLTSRPVADVVAWLRTIQVEVAQ